MGFSLTDEQDRALESICDWFRDDRGAQYLTLGGYAGTGKSTLMALLPDRLALRSERTGNECLLCGRALVSTRLTLERRVGADCYRIILRCQDQVGDKLDVARAVRDEAIDVLRQYGLHDLATRMLLVREKTPDLARVAFVAPTGKAADVLRRKLLERQVPHASCSTIHSFLYKPLLNEKGEVIGWERRTAQSDDGIDLVICDEASMVTSDVWRDLLGSGYRVLAVGDHGQLPPVGQNFGLMASPALTLETVHRQAVDNPIVALATAIRLGQPLDRVPTGGSVWFGQGRRTLDSWVRSFVQAGGITEERAVLVHRNRTRCDLNRLIREMLGRNGTPTVGDLVIGRKNFRVDDGLRFFNGQRAVVEEIFEPEGRSIYDPNTGQEFASMARFRIGLGLRSIGIEEDFRLEANLLQFYRPETFRDVADFNAEARPDPATDGQVRHLAQLGALLDYGYALTVHSAQGSEFEEVILAVEPSVMRCTDPPDFARRWAYTGVSRASKKLAVVWT